MRRLLVIALLTASCDKGAVPRLFTDGELSALEAQVLAQVAQSKSDCIRPEAIALWKPTGELAECLKACGKVEFSRDSPKLDGKEPFQLFRLETPQIVELDKRCGALVTHAVHEAALHPGCSPYQVGIDNGPIEPVFAPFMHLAHLSVRHARMHPDGGALDELIDVLAVYQDLGRGRTNLILAMIAGAYSRASIAAISDLIAQHGSSPERLEDAATRIDRLISATPPVHDMLLGELAYMSLMRGVTTLETPGWVPPGGTGDSMLAIRSTTHDPRDEAAILILSAQKEIEDIRASCSPPASMQTCVEYLGSFPPSPSWKVGEILDRPRADDEATRRRLKKQLVDDATHPGMLSSYTAQRAGAIARMVALRLQIQIARDGRCPTADELARPPYSTIRAPAALGDSVVVEPIDHALVVRPPTWARKAHPPKLHARDDVTIPCP